MTKIDANIKQQILDDLKVNNLSVSKAAKKYQISPKTIYNWLQAESPEAELKSLKKQCKELKLERDTYIKLIQYLSKRVKKTSSENYKGED